MKLKWGLRLLALIGVLFGVLGCAGLEPDIDNRGSILENGVFGDLRARKPAGNSNTARGLIPISGQAGKTEIFGVGGYSADENEGTALGGGSGTATGGAPLDSATAGSFRLNFENAELKDVIHAVMADALQLNYTVGPDVAGTVTISSTRAVGRDELLGTLETILSSQGFSLVKSGSVYKIGPTTNGGGQVNVGSAQPGYGISILPLRFVSVKTMSRLLGGFVADAEGLRIDTTRNALVISGPGTKRDEVIQTALSFDADWMANQTVAIFELRQANPDAIVTELEKVFDAGASGSANGAIQFQAIKRLKSVMAVSKNATLIQRAETWVRRLDQQSEVAGDNVFIYRARYRDAKDLAKILSSLFGASSSTVGGSTTSGPSSTAPTPTGDGGDPNAGGDGTGGDGSGGDGTGDSTGDTGGGGEQPIDNVTGAGDGGDTGTPDVIDLTTQGGSGDGGGPQIKVSADVANNSVVTYTDAITYQRVLATLKELDGAPLQVEINATIAEVTLTDELKYGVQYFLKSKSLGLDADSGSIGFQSPTAIASQIPGFNLLLGAAKDPQLIISALDQITNVEVLSSPSLVVMENQTGSLQVGEDVPIAVTQQQSTTTTSQIINQIQYRNTGIILKVTPRIGENGAVTMTIQQEISAVRNGTGGSLNPTFTKRSINSQISVVSGQTVVLAGLITSQKDLNRDGLPLISRIPLLNDVAGKTGKKGTRSELVVLIKPTVIYDGEDAQSVAEDLRSRLWAIGSRERKSP